ncbi:MAG: hypothetical protein P8X74_11940 [Reinekea sp.]
MTLIEIYGYLGSALIAVSLMMSNIKQLRWINLIGAGMFASYGLIILAWPVAVLNGFIVLIDIYHLYQLYRTKASEHTTRLRVDNPYITNVLAEKWPQLSKIPANSEIEVTFLGSEPTRFDVVA